ncbi:MAG TPA: hypothetical protein VF203_01380 [Burkholderiales bacterium]
MNIRLRSPLRPALLALSVALAAACVRDEPPPARSDAPAPPAPATRSPPGDTGDAEVRTPAPASRREPVYELRDMTGRVREPKRGVTPGALEAEGGDAGTPRTEDPERVRQKKP